MQAAALTDLGLKHPIPASMMTAPTNEDVLQLVFSVGLALWLSKFWNTLFSIPPRGRMPSLASFLRQKAPPRPRRADKLAQQLPSADAMEDTRQDIQFRPAFTLSDVWDTYMFAGSFSDVNMALQVIEFPNAFLDWRKSVGLVPGLTSAPAGRIDPQVSRRTLRGSEQEIVCDCKEMLDGYGFSLIAATGSGKTKEKIVGTATLRVRWLPEGSHWIEDADGSVSVVRSVTYATVREKAGGLEAVAYLEALAVAPEWRGTGLATDILEFAEDSARGWGLRILALHAERDDWRALRFYAKSGFEITSDWLGRGPLQFLLIKAL